MLNSYLHPNHTPTDARKAAHAELLNAVRRLNESATELEQWVASDAEGLAEHGDEWAADQTMKVTLVQRVVSINDDIARAQKALFGAVSQASRA